MCADEARRRHAGGRPGEPGARRDRPEAARARGPRRRARRARGLGGRRRPAGELPRPALSLLDEARARAALRGGARRRARTPAAARRGARAHVPDLRRPRCAARPAARHEGAALVHALACERAAPARGAPVDDGRLRRPALVPARVAQARPDRPRDRPRRLRVCRTHEGERPPAARARPHVAVERARDGDSRRRRGAGCPALDPRAVAHRRGAAPS